MKARSVLTCLCVVFAGCSLFGAAALQKKKAAEYDFESIKLIKDSFGMSHLYADDEAAGFFGYGYLKAEFRGDEFISLVMQARGTLAKYNGPRAVESDLLVNLYEANAHGEKGLECMPDDFRALTQAFADGMNAYYASHPSEKYPSFHMNPEDLVYVERWALIIHECLRPELNKFRRLLGIKRLFAMTGPAPEIAETVDASNSFLLAPAKTADNRTALVVSPHTGWGSGGHEIHFNSGRFHFVGQNSRGRFLMGIGHNGHIAIGGSNNNPDMADIYKEKLLGEKLDHYEYDGKELPIQKRTITLEIGDGVNVKKKSFDLQATHHGPMLHIDKKAKMGYVIANPFIQDHKHLLSRFLSTLATSVYDMRDLMAQHMTQTPTLIVGDKDGNLLYIHYGRTPRRNLKYDWTKPVPGWTKETDWGEALPLEEMPVIINPASGFIQTANDAPWCATIDPGFGPGDFPVTVVPKKGHGFGGGPSPRGLRLLALLSPDKKFTVEEIQTIAWDVYVVKMDWVTEVIKSAAQKAPKGSDLGRAFEILLAWDRNATLDSTGATLFQGFIQLYKPGYHEEVPNTEANQKKVLGIMKKVVTGMKKTYGKIDVPWGEVHGIERDGFIPCEAGTQEMQTVHLAGKMGKFKNGKWYSDMGTAYHFMVMLGKDRVDAWAVLPYGLGRTPEDPYYNDQTKLYGQRKFRKYAWYDDEVMADAKETYGFDPIKKAFMPKLIDLTKPDR